MERFGTNFELPKEFNLRAFESIKIGPESLQQKLDSVVKYLRLPYVTDNFGTDAEARRAWRKEVIAEYGKVAREVFENNKLRAYCISPTYTFIEFFAHQYYLAGLEKDPFGAKVIALYKKMPPEIGYGTYDNLDDMNKMRVTAELSNIATEFLQLLSAEPKEKSVAA